MPGPEAHRYDVRDRGATGDGEQLDTAAIQSALDECRDGDGGTVLVPPGTYLTAPLRVGDDTTVHLEAGATLSFVGDAEAFPSVESRWEGWDQVGFHPCLWVVDAANVAITGRGTIDGGGRYWWDLYGVPDEDRPPALRERLAEFDERNEKRDDVSSFTLRPPLLQIARSEDVSVSGVTLRNSPFWNTHVLYSENVTIHDVTVRNPEEAPNGDGIDVDSSRFVRISDAHVSAGDDAICIKSGKDAEGREVGEPAAGITVTNCTVEAGHGGVVIGSETAGDVRDVTVSNCTFTDTDRGIRIKTQRGRGGVVEDLRFDTIVMRRVACPFVVNGYYFTDIDADPAPVDAGTPTVRNVHFSNVTVREAESAGFLAGLPERRFGEISFSGVRIDATRPLDATDVTPAMADGYAQRHGLFCKSLADVSLSDVRVVVPRGPALQVEASDRLLVDGAAFDTDGSAAGIELEDVRRTRVRGCGASEEGTLLRARGPDTDVVSLATSRDALRAAIDVEDHVTVDVE